MSAVKNISIPDIYDSEDCNGRTDEDIAELYKQELLKTLKQFNNKKIIAMNTHIVILTEGDNPYGS